MSSTDEKIIQLLADTTNRAILTVLKDIARDLPVTGLAEQMLSREINVVSTSDYDQKLDQLILTLHHDKLPRLDEAGLLEYDHKTNTVAYGSYTAVDPEWKNLEIFDELLSRLQTKRETETNGIGLLEGRESVYEHCRRLADESDDELFLIYASDELLDEECLPHAEKAIERGVDLHAGTKSQSAREFFQKFLPEVRVWEPQMDWMYEASSYPKISRLAFSDREKVAIGLWVKDENEARKEIAMVGEGESNPIVVLVRELLGSRLDHLDYQSDDLLESLPFNDD